LGWGNYLQRRKDSNYICLLRNHASEKIDYGVKYLKGREEEREGERETEREREREREKDKDKERETF
jgi:hypothetical protein